MYSDREAASGCIGVILTGCLGITLLAGIGIVAILFAAAWKLIS